MKILQFLNDAANRGIRLDSASRESYSRVFAEVSWRDYARLQALAKNRPLRVVPVNRGGLPYIGALAVRRLAFTLGLLACVAALAFVNRYVLDVRVAGCTTQGLEQKVYAVLDSQGLKPGVAKTVLDLHTCEDELMLRLPEISFAAVRVNGVVATVNIVEGAPVPRLIDRNIPCDVVAGRDAVVRKVIVLDGEAKVVSGDPVKSGQVLVSGLVTTADGGRLVHARAEVLAGVWYEGRGSAPLFVKKGMPTGQVEETRALAFAGFTLPVDGGGEPAFADFTTEEKEYFLLGPGLKGPKLSVTRYAEVRKTMDETDFSLARESAFLQAESEASAQLPRGAQIVDARTVYGIDGTNIVAKVYIETQENIAVESPLR